MIQKIVRIDDDVWKELFLRKISGNERTINDVIRKLLEKNIDIFLSPKNITTKLLKEQDEILKKETDEIEKMSA